MLISFLVAHLFRLCKYVRHCLLCRNVYRFMNYTFDCRCMSTIYISFNTYCNKGVVIFHSLWYPKIFNKKKKMTSEITRYTLNGKTKVYTDSQKERIYKIKQGFSLFCLHLLPSSTTKCFSLGLSVPLRIISHYLFYSSYCYSFLVFFPLSLKQVLWWNLPLLRAAVFQLWVPLLPTCHCRKAVTHPIHDWQLLCCYLCITWWVKTNAKLLLESNSHTKLHHGIHTSSKSFAFL